jgi:pyruvate dehydrogenase (quinone)
VELPPIDFAAFAHACGGVGQAVDDPAQCGGGMDQFLSAPRPAIQEALVDPLEAPLPAKITAHPTLKFAESLARGEPDGGKTIAKALGTRVRELI